jgi:hypothetical protein
MACPAIGLEEDGELQVVVYMYTLEVSNAGSVLMLIKGGFMAH